MTATDVPPVLSYTVRGEVRLGLLWVGRDNVGGGTIARRRMPDDSGGYIDEIAVLFGSHPERVPGGVNVWGYARERSYRRNDGQATLVLRSEFDAFLRPRDQAQRPIPATSPSRVLFKVFRGVAVAGAAGADIHWFLAGNDDYRRPEPTLRAFEAGLAGEPREQDVPNTQPYGFLSAVDELIHTTASPIIYTHQARQFRLERIATERHQQVDIVHFHVAGLADGSAYDFTIDVAADGPLRGVPIGLSFQPRWWLRLRADLLPSPPGAR